VLLDHGVVDRFGDMRLEAPEAGAPRAARDHVVKGAVAAILNCHAPVELQGEAADRWAVAEFFVIIDIRAAQTFGRPFAEVPAGFDEDHLLAELGRLHRGDDPALVPP
jgi:hypothetical protein